MIVDYYFIRKKELDAVNLYKEDGEYTYSKGFNIKAIVALLLGILPNIPGFLLQVKLIAAEVFPEWINHLYNYAWFVGFFVSGVVYYILMRKK